MILSIKEIHIYDNNSDIVSLTNISEGVDGASVFGFTSEPEYINIEDNQSYLIKKNHTLDVRILKPASSDLTILNNWIDNNTKVFISIRNLDDSILSIGDINNPDSGVHIVKNEQLSSNDIFSFKVTKSSTTGFNPSNGIYEGSVFAGFNVSGITEWGDKVGDGIADGWTYSTNSRSFSSNIQYLDADTSTKTFSRNVLFPYASETSSLSFTIDSQVGTYNTNRIRLEFYDKNKSFISSDNYTVTGLGRNQNIATIPINTVYVKISLQISSTTGSVTTGVSFPSFRLGTSSAYTKF